MYDNQSAEVGSEDQKKPRKQKYEEDVKFVIKEPQSMYVRYFMPDRPGRHHWLQQKKITTHLSRS